MADEADLLVEASFAPDPDADQELGPPATAIADEEVRGCRLLLVRRAAEPIAGDAPAGAVQFACTFQPAHGIRFVWARLSLRLQAPAGVAIIDVAPREAPDEPVQFTIDTSGKIGFSYAGVEVGGERRVGKEFAVYHCKVQGSGEGTAHARWDFQENPHKHEGLGREQVLALTLAAVGEVSGTVGVSARLSRAGVLGAVDAVRDVILGPHRRSYPVSFVIPPAAPASGFWRFLGRG